ncbi:MAG: hypothetical protein K8R34_07400 [Methanosarcinales archaeon]|nr:hypothetical protein [Methanosarcinales archaeon]
MTEKTNISLLEKFSILYLLFMAIYIIYLYYSSVIDVLSGKEFKPQDFIVNLTIVVLGVCALWGGITLAKRTIAMGQLIDIGFENGVYSRLEPILEEIAGTQVVINKMDERLNNMNINMDQLKKRSVEFKIPGNEPAFGIDISAQISRFLRLIILINITLVVFIFLLNFTRSYTPFILTIMFIVWWLEITYEYTLWEKSSAYYWVFFPILTIPITTILGDIMYGSGILIGSMGILLALYVSAYYTWSKYIIEGILPFDLNKPISRIPSDNIISSHFFSSRIYFIQHHYKIGKILITISIIFTSLLIIQLFSVNIYYIKFLPNFSLDQFVFLGIFSIIFYILGVRLKHNTKENETETI